MGVSDIHRVQAVANDQCDGMLQNKKIISELLTAVNKLSEVSEEYKINLLQQQARQNQSTQQPQY